MFIASVYAKDEGNRIKKKINIKYLVKYIKFLRLQQFLQNPVYKKVVNFSL